MTIEQRKVFFVSSFFISLMLSIWLVHLYRRTIVPLLPLFVIVIVVTLFAFIWVKKSYNEAYGTKGSFYGLGYSLPFGLTACFAMIAINYYWKQGANPRSYHFPIESKGSFSGGRFGSYQPYITFYYKDLKKQLVFSSEYEEEINRADSVLIIVEDGALGYEVIRKQEVK